uniref:Uncharacterized protein n=1 Tax=Arundo donax TaxID=35708 RepID=A0A0A9BQ74_ARUDO
MFRGPRSSYNHITNPYYVLLPLSTNIKLSGSGQSQTFFNFNCQ